MNALSTRPQTLCNDLVMIDGLAGSGKTMLSPIVASLQRGELMTYAFEVQYYCNLYHLGEISLNAAKNLVKLYIDLKLYNSMMGREMNFRPTDLSSALKSPTPEKYIARLFDKGDESIPDKIKNEKPIMNFLMHNTLPYARPIVEAFDNKIKFIEVLRHPLYMIKQQALNFQNLVGSVRDIDVYIEYNGTPLPFYTLGQEERFIEANPYERAILYLDHFTKLFGDISLGESRLQICFEKFVLSPEEDLQKICSFLKTGQGDKTLQVLTQSKIPRHKTVQGVDLDIYRRCGWTPSNETLSEQEELDLRYQLVKNEVRPEFLILIDKNINQYERKFWKP